jgi:tetratricopeptide (TPR) repeat protein
MKKKCPICKTGKARRECNLKDGAVICSRCCAEVRGTECGECPYYEEAMLHAMQRSAGLPNGHFIAEINPQVQEEVDGALELAVQGDMTEAFGVMNRLMDENPRNHDVCYGMGCLYAISGKNTEAISWFKKAISIFPYMGEAYYNLGIAYQKTYNLGRMITALRNAVKYGDPEQEYYQSARSQLENAKQVISQNGGVDLDRYVASSEKFEDAFEKMENRQWDAALKGFRAAAAQNEKNAPTHGNMGICLLFLGRKAEALAAFDRALEIDPGYEPALSNRVLAEKVEEGVPPEGANYKSINYAAEKVEKACADRVDPNG